MAVEGHKHRRDFSLTPGAFAHLGCCTNFLGWLADANRNFSLSSQLCSKISYKGLVRACQAVAVFFFYMADVED